jgi:hypothetical protein
MFLFFFGYFLIPFLLFFFVRIFFLDTLILLHFKYSEMYFGPCLPGGPLLCAYK